jgi:hypothetical protein
VEETHFEIVTLFVYNVLNFPVNALIFYDDVIFENNRVLEVLIETPSVKLHVAHVTPNSP